MWASPVRQLTSTGEMIGRFFDVKNDLWRVFLAGCLHRVPQYITPYTGGTQRGFANPVSWHPTNAASGITSGKGDAFPSVAVPAAAGVC